MFHNESAHFVNGIILNVRDKDEMKKFYGDIIGLNVVNESYSTIQYEVGNLNHFMTLNQINIKYISMVANKTFQLHYI